QNVAATVTDDDTAGVTISKTMLSVSENGGTNTYTVVLDSQPVSQVLIRVTSDTESAAKLTAPSDSTQRGAQVLTFLASNWSTAQTVTVHGQNDDIDNSGDERTATLSHSSSNSSDATYRALTVSDTVAVTVTDDDAAGVTVSRTAVTTAEGFASGNYTVKLDSRPTRIVRVTVTSSDNTVAGVDGPDVSGNYTASEVLTFTTSNWNSAQAVRVYGRPDTIDNPNDKRTTTITHTSSSTDAKYNELTIGSVDVEVTDDDDAPTSVTLTATPATIAEDASGTARNVVVKASVDGATRFGTSKTVNVTGARTSGTVDVGAITPFTITIPAAGDSGTHTVTLVPGNDVVDETDATITFSGMLTGVTVNSGTVTVTDDDDTPTTIALSLSRTSMRENDATQEITVTATVQGSTTFGVEKTVTVSVAGSGQAGRVPFAAVDDFDITIPVGTRSATGTFNLDPTDNNRDETNETVTVSGSSGTLTVTSATATLVDDDAAPSGVALSVDDDAVNEGDGAQTITVTAAVQGTTRYALARTVTVSVAGSGDADVVGFTAVGNFDITIAAGADSGTNTFMLTPTDDSVDEYDETITVSGAGSDVASVTSDTIELSDNDDTTVTMSAPSGDVGEASGTKDVTLTLSRALVGAEAVTVSLTVVGAEAGTDYAFGLHPSAQTGVQLLVSDPHSEQDPAVALTAGASSAVLRFDPSDNSVRTQPWIVISHTVSSDNVDLAEPLGGPVDFAITDDETGDIVVAGDWGLKPSALGPNSRFRLVFTTSGERDAASTDIADYDAFVRGLLAEGNPDIVPYAGFFKALGSTASTDASSHNGFGGNTTIGVYWLGGLTTSDAVATNYPVFRGEWSNQNRPRDEDGTLVSVDSTGYFTGSLPDGSKSNQPLGSTNVRLGFLNDSGNGRAPLGNGTAGGATRSQSQQGKFYGLSPVLRVTTQPTVTIEADASSVTEGTAASFTVTATNAGQPVSADLTISLLVTADAAIVDPDDTGTKSVTVAAGASTASFTVATIGDAVDEADEPVQVAVLSGALYGVGDPGIARVTVADDDATTLELSLGAGIGSDDPSISEGSSGTLNLALGRTLAAGEQVTVPLTFSGSATRGTDYSLSCSGVGVTCANLDSGNARVVIAGGSSAAITVSALPDADHPETGESVDVGLGTPTAPGLSGGFATPADNAPSIAIASLPPAAVTASFASDAYTATEAAASRTVNARLNLSPAPTSAIAIGYTVTGTAASGDDYTALSGTVNASPGDTFVDVAVTVIDDNIDDDGETVVLTLTTSPLYNAGANGSTTVTITDDDDAPSAIALSLSPVQIIEGDGPSAVTVTATVQGATRFGVARTVSVSASRTSGTVDVEEVTSFTITIPAGAQSAEAAVTVTPTNDQVAKQNAVVTFAGQLAGVSVASTELTVAEDDITPTVIHLSVNPTSISEGATGSDRVVTVTATVQGASTFGTARTLSVRGTKTSGGVAVANTAQAPLTIPAGARSASITLTVAPTDDNRDDANTQFTISGPQIVGGTPVTVRTVVLTVVDDDGAPSAVDLSVSPQTLAENAGATTVTVTATVQGATRFGADRTLAVSVSGSGASNLVGFTASPESFDLTIPSGQASAAAMFTLTPTDDGAYQAPETVTVSGLLAGVAVGAAKLTLTDDDARPPAVSFASARSSAAEGGGAHTVTLNLDAPAPAGMSVSYVLAGTALLGTDYAMLSGSSAVTEGATTAGIDVPVTADAEHEDAETVVITLTRGPLSGYTLGSSTTHTVSITDDDPAPAAAFVPGDWALKPADLTFGDRFRLLFVTSTGRRGDSFDIAGYNGFVQGAAAQNDALAPHSSLFRAVASTPTVDARDNTDTNTAVDGPGVAIYWVADATTAKVADDYADFYDSTWGSTAATHEDGMPRTTFDGSPVGSLDPPLLQRAIWTGSLTGGRGATGQELGTAEPGVGDIYTAGQTGSTPLRYSLDTFPRLRRRSLYALSPVFEVRGPALSVSSGAAARAGDTVAPPSFTITADPPTSGPLTVHYTVTAQPGAVPASELNSKTATLDGKEATFTIPSRAAAQSNPSVTVTVDEVDGDAYTVGARSSASLTVVSTGSTPVVTVEAIDSEVTEGDSAEFQILTIPSLTAGSIRYTVTQSGNVLAAGELGSKTVPAASGIALQIPTDGDSTDEPDGSVTVTVEAGSGYILGLPVSATIPVVDDDAAPSSVALSVSPSSVAEDAGATEVTVTATVQGTTRFGADRTVTVSVTGPNSDGMAGFHPVASFNVTIPAGADSGAGTFTLTPVDDTIANDAQTITVSGTLRGGAVAPTLLSLTNDDDTTTLPPSMQPVLTVMGGSAVTEGSQASFTISADPAATTPLTVNYTVAQNGMFVAPGQIGSKSLTLTGSSASFTIPTQGDAVDETDGSVTVTLASGTGYTPGSPATASVVVNDDDAAEPTDVALSVSPTSISESATGSGRTVTVTATIQGTARFATAKTVSVTAAKTSGSVGVTITPSSPTITINAGARTGTATVTVAPQNDTTAETDAVVTFSGVLSGVAVASTTFRVEDDDAPPMPSTVRLSVSPNSISESATGSARNVTVRATIVGSARFTTSQTVAVSASKVSGSVEVGPVAPFNITIASGAASGSATVTVVPQNDSVDETDAVIRFTGTLSNVTV
ncbi:MAG: hypothetical protein F4Z23_10760, partial [Acidimicrobiaceae bacterium]|nr:hypothetical protein [Acidimicrobiaceae bacterium]